MHSADLPSATTAAATTNKPVGLLGPIEPREEGLRLQEAHGLRKVHGGLRGLHVAQKGTLVDPLYYFSNSSTDSSISNNIFSNEQQETVATIPSTTSKTLTKS